MQYLLQDMGIGHNIRKLRKQAGLTQVEVVAQMQTMGVDIHMTAYIKIEGEYRNVKVSYLVALTDILSCEYNDFFAGLK